MTVTTDAQAAPAPTARVDRPEVRGAVVAAGAFGRRVLAGSGLTTPGAVVAGAVLIAFGGLLDAALGDGLGLAFATMFIVACAAMATTLRVRSLATAVIAPPLLFAAASVVAARLSGEVNGSRALALDTATSLALSAPVLFGGTGLAAAIALVRLVLTFARRRPATATAPD